MPCTLLATPTDYESNRAWRHGKPPRSLGPLKPCLLTAAFALVGCAAFGGFTVTDVDVELDASVRYGGGSHFDDRETLQASAPGIYTVDAFYQRVDTLTANASAYIRYDMNTIAIASSAFSSDNAGRTSLTSASTRATVDFRIEDPHHIGFSTEEPMWPEPFEAFNAEPNYYMYYDDVAWVERSLTRLGSDGQPEETLHRDILTYVTDRPSQHVSLTLDPGDYRLEANLIVSYSWHTGGRGVALMSFDLTESIPEPSAAILIGLAAVTAIASRARRTRRVG